MHFEPSEVYSLYNCGNDKQQIFFNDDNYLFFLRKIRAEWLPLVDILAYCLVPDHFEFLVVPGKLACCNITIKEKETHLQVFSKVIGKTLSSYARAINIEQFRTGNLFQKKTRAKLLSPSKLSSSDFSIFLRSNVHEIHQLPVVEGLVRTTTEWPFSSAQDYANVRNGTLCNKELFEELTGVIERSVSSKDPATSKPHNQTIIDPKEYVRPL
jgi:putative transposase